MRIINCLSLLFMTVFISPFAFAQHETTNFLPNVFACANGQSLPYRLYVPMQSGPGTKYPLVLWLHGAAGRGTDNLKNISGGNDLGSHVWTYPENQKLHPCFVLAPQCPDTSFWVTNDGREDPPDQLDLVVQLLAMIENTYPVDTTRVYVTGQSIGGIAAWEILERYPLKFAAGIPLCGLSDTRKAHLLTKIPLWVFHGTADSVIGVAHAREMVDAIRKAGGHPKYTEYKGVGHDVWSTAFKERSLLPWVFSQHR